MRCASLAVQLLLLHGALAVTEAEGDVSCRSENDSAVMLQQSRQLVLAEAEAGIVRIDFSRNPRARSPLPTWREIAAMESRRDCEELQHLLKQFREMREIRRLFAFLCTPGHREALMRLEHGCLYLPNDHNMQKFYDAVEHPNPWHFDAMVEDSFFPANGGPCPTEAPYSMRARGAEGTEITTCKVGMGRNGFVSVDGRCILAVPLGRTPQNSSNIRVYKLAGMLGLDLTWEQLLADAGGAALAKGVALEQRRRTVLETAAAEGPAALESGEQDAQTVKAQKGGAGKKPAGKQTGETRERVKRLLSTWAHSESGRINEDFAADVPLGEHATEVPHELLAKDWSDDYNSETYRRSSKESKPGKRNKGSKAGKGNKASTGGKSGKGRKVKGMNGKGQLSPSLRPPTSPPAPKSALISIRYYVCDPGTGYISGNATDERLAAQTAVLNRAFGGQDKCQSPLAYKPSMTDTGFRFQQEQTIRFTNALCATECVANGRILEMTQDFAKREDGMVKVVICDTQLLGMASFPQDDDSIRVCIINCGTLPGSYIPRYNEGKSLTHEMGHYLGLYHTFENGCDSPGDSVSDTGPERQPHYGCPGYRTSTCPQGGTDPVHNIMDYSDDPCMCAFTAGQKAAMWERTGLDQADLLPEPAEGSAL